MGTSGALEAMSMLACHEVLAGFDDEFMQVFRHDNFIAVIAMSVGCLIAVTGIIGATVRGIVKSRAVEQTKRELAAYVAEGTLDPDKAIAMLNAGGAAPGGKCGCA